LADYTPAVASGPQISGELRKWHRVTLTFDGPETHEQATPNPFRDYRLFLTFSHGDRRYHAPGFYAADGNAAETSADAGNKWRVHFAPDEEGEWTYAASFRIGKDVAIDSDPSAGKPVAFDGACGRLEISATDKTGRDHRAKGMLRYVGEHYLQFAENDQFFLKGGADSPENFLAYADFDATPRRHKYQPHVADWVPGDPTWRQDKGKGIIGALNYLSSKGMNSVYFLSMNVRGDGKDVWPWTSKDQRYRFDCSKLDQWEIVFSHMDAVGVLLHLVTQEQENDQLLDSGELGVQRKLYYRELIARFSHHLAVVWNLGEENTNTDEQIRQFCEYVRELDPYNHPIVVHTFPGDYDEVYSPLLGYRNFEGPSLQTYYAHRETMKWRQQSAQAGRKWVVCLDEIGPARTGVKPDEVDPEHDTVRKLHLWGNLMAGGAGCEWYFGHRFANNDLNCEDWRSRDRMWDLTRFALEFFQQHLPFADMSPADHLISASDGYCFAKSGEVYAIYLPEGGTTQIRLPPATYNVRWYNPRTGGQLLAGTVKQVAGPGSMEIGHPPRDVDQDWAALLRLAGQPPKGSGK
jgi:hypothetical protein